MIMTHRQTGTKYLNRYTGSSYFITDADQCFFKAAGAYGWVEYIGGRDHLVTGDYINQGSMAVSLPKREEIVAL